MSICLIVWFSPASVEFLFGLFASRKKINKKTHTIAVLILFPSHQAPFLTFFRHLLCTSTIRPLRKWMCDSVCLCVFEWVRSLTNGELFRKPQTHNTIPKPNRYPFIWLVWMQQSLNFLIPNKQRVSSWCWIEMLRIWSEEAVHSTIYPSFLTPVMASPPAVITRVTSLARKLWPVRWDNAFTGSRIQTHLDG